MHHFLREQQTNNDAEEHRPPFLVACVCGGTSRAELFAALSVHADGQCVCRVLGADGVNANLICGS